MEASPKINQRAVAAIRLLFGAVWAVDAAFKCTPMFYRMLLENVKAAGVGMPPWTNGWFHFWQNIIGAQPHVFATLITVSECALTLSLLFGIFRRQMYAFGVAFSLLIWGVGEAFGGPYSSMSTDIGAACIYAFVFALLFVVDLTPTWTLGSKLFAKKSGATR